MSNITPTSKNSFAKIARFFSKREEKPVKVTQKDLENKEQVLDQKKNARNTEIKKLKDVEDKKFTGDTTQRPKILKLEREYAKSQQSYKNLKALYDKQERNFR